MKSICFVSPAHYLNTVGGAEVQLHLMAAGLAALNRYDVFYVTPDIREPTVNDGVRVVRISNDDGGKECTFDDFARTLDSVVPDLVLQLGRKQFTVYAARYCALRKVPFVFSAASDIDCRLLREFPRYFGEFSPRRWLTPGRPAKALAMDCRTLRAMRSADVVVAQTAGQQQKLSALCKKPVSLFQNLHHVPPEDGITKDDPPVVLWLASMKSVKRPWLFLEIAAKLRGSGCRVVMAGRMNDEQFRPDIEAAAGRGDLEYLEHVSFEQSNDLISRAKVFVITSRHEGLPNTLIQAWLRRTPTVSLGVDPDGMIAEHGIGVHADTVDESAAAILSLVRDGQRCDQVAAAARRFAIDRFGMASQAERLRELIDRSVDAG